MLFNSDEFVFGFLPAVLLVFFLLGRGYPALAAAWLALASLFFYGYGSPRYVPLLLASVVFNYFCGRALTARAGTPSGRRWLTASIAADLALLGFYKYADFFLASVGAVAHTPIPLLRIVLPVGISFFTFTQIAFIVDCYRGEAREYRFVHYLLFATYFPHLIAGPILHHKEIMPQFESACPYRPSSRSFSIGFTVFAIGLAKKVLLADNFSTYCSPVFAAAHTTPIPFLTAWVGSLAYTFQLYFDFSGYSDMAIGISKLFGVDLPINFFSPYQSTNIIDFWRRWHMTLARFLRDYLYFPLGGGRKGPLRRSANLMITLLLGGLWHGASWTFVAWGGLHGTYLLINHGWRSVLSRSPAWHASSRPPRILGRMSAGALTFLAVVIGWVFFRADDFGSAANILGGMFGTQGVGSQNPSSFLWVLLLTGAFLVWAMPNTRQIAERLASSSWSSGMPLVVQRAVPAIAGLILALAILQTQEASEFLYFRF